MANENMILFFETFDKAKAKYPDLYLQVKEFSREPRRWRIHVLGKSFSPKGDSEFVFVEESDREEAFKQANARMATLEDNIARLKEIETYGTSFRTNHN